MKKLLFLPFLFMLAGCTIGYDYSLILNNDSTYDLNITIYSPVEQMLDTVMVRAGEERAIMYSSEDEFGEYNCSQLLDSVDVEVIGFASFNGSVTDEEQWTNESYKKQFIDITFCTFTFNNQNIN
jgi:hypothetical protein